MIVTIESLLILILSVAPAASCNSLKWKELMTEFDSLTHNNTAFLFYFHPKSKKEIAYILKRDKFEYPVCIDDADSINKLNQFPSRSCRTFRQNCHCIL